MCHFSTHPVIMRFLGAGATVTRCRSGRSGGCVFRLAWGLWPQRPLDNASFTAVAGAPGPPAWVTRGDARAALVLDASGCRGRGRSKCKKESPRGGTSEALVHDTMGLRHCGKGNRLDTRLGKAKQLRAPTPGPAGHEHWGVGGGARSTPEPSAAALSLPSSNACAKRTPRLEPRAFQEKCAWTARGEEPSGTAARAHAPCWRTCCPLESPNPGNPMPHGCTGGCTP